MSSTDTSWVVKHLGLVHLVARRRYLTDPALEYEDIVGAGMVGLMKAAQSYNPSRGAFSGYAVPRIRGEIGELFRRQQSLERTDTRVDDPGPLADDRPTALDEHLQIERRDKLRAAVDRLPAHERAVIAGVYFGNQKAKVIALRLGLTESRISQLRAAALRRLALTLSEFAHAA